MSEPLIAQPTHHFEKLLNRSDSSLESLRPNMKKSQEVFTLPPGSNHLRKDLKSPESKAGEEHKSEKNGNDDTVLSKDQSPSQQTSSINPAIPSAIPAAPLSDVVAAAAAEPGTGFQGGVNLPGRAELFLLPPDSKLTAGETSPSEENAGSMPAAQPEKDNKNELSLSNPGSPAPLSIAMKSDANQSLRKSEGTSSLETSGSEMGMNPISVGKKEDPKREAEYSSDENKNGNQRDQNTSTDLISHLVLDGPKEGSLNQNVYSAHRTGGGNDPSALSMQALPTGEKEILQQLTGWLSAHRSNELQTIRLKLTPESLGTIQIDLSVQNQQVKADMIASSEQVKQLLERHQDLLRNGLADSGLRIDQLTVRLEETSQFQAGGSMNSFKGFSQRENPPTQAFWNQSETPNPFSRSPLPVDRTFAYSENRQGRVSIYI